MTRRLARVLGALVIAFGLGLEPVADARGGSPSSGGHSSFAVSRPPTAASHAAPKAGAGSGFGVSRAGAPATPAKGSAAPAQTATKPVGSLERAAAMSGSRAAFARYQAEQKASKVAAAPVPRDRVLASPIYASTRSRWHSADDYWRERDAATSAWRARAPPAVAVYQDRLPSGYGVFSTLLLLDVLSRAGSNANAADWAYTHRDDPDYIRWRMDMQRQADASHDAAMQAQIADLDAKVAALEAAKAAPLAAGALPDGVDPALAVAPGAVMAASQSRGHFWYMALTLMLVGGILGTLYVSRHLLRPPRRFAP